MKLIKSRDQDNFQTIITLTVGDGEMERLKFSPDEQRVISENLASDKISANLHALRVIAMRAEKMARALARLSKLN
jgi:hypothetical protein